MSLYEQVTQDHQSSSYSGPNNKWAGCTCGTDFTWEYREEEHEAHVIAEFEKALRAQISSELRQLSHEADTPAEQLGYLLAAIHVNEGTLQ